MLYTEIGEHRIAWRSFGEGPPVLIEHALTGAPDVAAWWPRVLAALGGYRVICANLAGSCYGTTGPELDAAGQAALQARWATAIGVERWALVAGGSLGGMIALQWAARYPDRVARCAAIAAPLVASAWVRALNHVQRRALLAGDLEIARAVGMISYRSPAGLARKPDVAAWLEHHGRALKARFSPEAYVALTRTMDSHAVDLSGYPGPLLALGIASDQLFSAAECRAVAAAAPRGRYAELASDEGHDAFLMDEDAVAAHLLTLLEDSCASD